jgi:hypothetical protein
VAGASAVGDAEDAGGTVPRRIESNNDALPVVKVTAPPVFAILREVPVATNLISSVAGAVAATHGGLLATHVVPFGRVVFNDASDLPASPDSV